MKVKLELKKGATVLHQGVYEIDDTESFSAAWQDVWAKARERWMAKTTSIGALMESIHEGVIDELNGAELRLTRL